MTQSTNAKQPYKTAAAPLPLPRLVLQTDLLAILQAYIDAADGEISGLGQIEIVNDTDFAVTALHLLNQLVTSGSTELDAAAIADFMEVAMDTGMDLESIKLWWHSHGHGSVFWSTTDETAIANLSNAGWMLSIVGNKRNEYLARLDIYVPVHVRIDLPVNIVAPPLPDDVLVAIRNEVDEKVVFVTPDPVPANPPTKGGRNGHKNAA